VLVYAGCNTALDVARTAKRFGATQTLVVQEALEEGIQFKWLSIISRPPNTTFTVEKMHSK
jgi:formate dehydrogenase beta subunit